MKKTIKILTVLLVALCFVSTVYAEEPTNPGSITINNTISGKTYELYKIFDLTYTGTEAENNLKVSYTIANAWKGFFLGTSAPGAKYLVDVEGYCDGDNTKTTQATCEVENTDNEWKFYNPTVIDKDTWLSYYPSDTVTDDVVKYIKITEDNVAEFAEDALAYAISHNITANKTASGTGSNVTVNNLELGYYLVYPKGASQLKESYASICSLDSTTPTMTVNIKAEEPKITKEIVGGNDRGNADVGDILTFKITGKVPDTTGFTSFKYQIDDKLIRKSITPDGVDRKGLELKSDTIVVKLGYTDDKGTETTTDDEYKYISLTSGEHYTLTASDETDTFSVDFTNMVGEYYQSKIGYDIIITYDVLVTEPIVSIEDMNEATLTYSNDPKNPTVPVTTEPVSVKAWSSKIVLYKIVKGTGTITDGVPSGDPTFLGDAKFVLYKIIDDTKYYYQAKDSTGAVITNVSSTSDVADVEWITTEANASLLVTDADPDSETYGILTFEGMENGTYYLLEKEAPDGYNKITRPIEVKVGWDPTLNDNHGGWVQTGVTKPVTVENTSGSLLPSTGGIGTKIFIIVGTIAILASGVVLVTRTRMKKEVM